MLSLKWNIFVQSLASWLKLMGQQTQPWRSRLFHCPCQTQCRICQWTRHQGSTIPPFVGESPGPWSQRYTKRRSARTAEFVVLRWWHEKRQLVQRLAEPCEANKQRNATRNARRSTEHDQNKSSNAPGIRTIADCDGHGFCSTSMSA